MLCLACQFYHACNGKASAYVTEQFHKWHYVWKRTRYKPHMAEYYNMHLGNFIYINGSFLNQPEPVLPEVRVIEFGIDNTSFHS